MVGVVQGGSHPRAEAVSILICTHGASQIPMSIVRRSVVAAAAAALLTLSAQAQVTASVIGGALVVQGSPSADALTISALGDAVTVSGNSGTTINGGASASFSGVVNGIAVDLGAGDDFLFMVGSAPLGSALFNMGAGDDVAVIARNVFSADFCVDAGDSGPNGDIVSLGGSNPGDGNTVAGLLVVVGVGQVGLGLRGSEVLGETCLLTEDRNDKFLINGNTFRDTVVMWTGDGDDRIEFASEPSSPANVVDRSVSVNVGQGNDLVRFGSASSAVSTIRRRTGIQLGFGDDTLEIANTIWEGPIMTRGGPGNDSASLQAVLLNNQFQQGVFALDFETLQ